MEKSFSILFKSFLILFLVRGHYAQSPCPEVFEYLTEDSVFYGIITVVPKHWVSSLNVKVKFTVSAKLPSKYLGTLQPLGKDLILDYNKGMTVKYRLHFPIKSPVPQITSITVNNDVICSGPGDSLGGNIRYVTSVGLEHTFHVGSETGPDTQPVTAATTTTTPKPTIDYGTIFAQDPIGTSSVDHSQCGINSNINSVPLIYNGLSYRRGDWPWVVGIFKQKKAESGYICAGTLISDSHVLTAAHCRYSMTSFISVNNLVVKVGLFDITQFGDDDVTVSRTVSSAIIHESFNYTSLKNDIMLLKFRRKVEFNFYIKPACLWSGSNELDLVVGSIGVVIGWGVSELTEAGKGEPRMVRMPIVSTTECRGSKTQFHDITSSTTLCAGDKKGAGPCFGDSGGGLYLRDKGRWKVRGIVSSSVVADDGVLACNLDDYIVFTDVAQYLPWIQNNM